ncbi:MAG: M20 family metallo-hydrolase [Elusimicrobia bacterium]|nr:M20 family metallo-hydrolase [Elusimicrobiota bacterium]
MEKQLFAKIDSLLEYAVELETGLTAIPAIAPSSGGNGEYDKAVWIEGELRKLKFDEIFRVDTPFKEAKNGIRPNIVARYKGQSSAKTLWIMTHMDVVPHGDLSLWKTDPYKVHREGNLIYGRGVEDNQQGLTASIVTLRAMMDLGYRPPSDIALLIVSDEETGNVHGAKYITQNHLKLFGKDDMFLVPDHCDPDGKLIEVAEKSILWLKIMTRGKQSHAAFPYMGINSFRAASDLVVKLNSLHKKFNRKDKIFDPPKSTFEPTKKEANVPNVNTVPGEDVFYLDCRPLPGYDVEDVRKEVRALADGIEKKYGVKISIETVVETIAAPPTSPDSEVVKLVIAGAKKVHKVKAKPMGIGGGTVAAYFRGAGFPSVVFSKANGTLHQPNECCDLNNLLADAKVFTYVAMNMKA